MSLNSSFIVDNASFKAELIELTNVFIEHNVESILNIIKQMSDKGIYVSRLSGSMITEMLIKFTTDSAKSLPDEYVNYLESQGIDSLENIKIKIVKNAINALSKAGADFSKLNNKSLEDLVKQFGTDIISPLSEVGADFSKWEIEESSDNLKNDDYSLKMIREIDVDSLADILSEVANDAVKDLLNNKLIVNKLDPAFVALIVNNLTNDIIKQLSSITIIDKSKLDSDSLAKITAKVNSAVINALSKAGADFSKLEIKKSSDNSIGNMDSSKIDVNYLPGEIGEIISEGIKFSSDRLDYSKIDDGNFLAKTVINFANDSKIYTLLGIDKSKLDSDSLAKINAEVSSAVINGLSEAGADFSKINAESLAEIVTKLGIDSIKPLSKVGCDFSTLKDPALKLIIEKELSTSKELASDVGKKLSEYSEISLDKSFICEDKGFNYADICYENDIVSENCLSCGHLGNPSEDFLMI